MKIISWNVNSIRKRLEILEILIKQESPDIIMLQEIKCLETSFPYEQLEHLNYNYIVIGQKTFNGVAILSRYPMELVIDNLPNTFPFEARYVEVILTVNNKVLRICNTYVVNGQNPKSEKFQYKMKFFDSLINRILDIKRFDEIIVLAGDFNVALDNIDVFDPKHLDGDIGFHIEERKKMRSLINTGLHDVFRIKNIDTQEFSWWNYRTGSLEKNTGMRIDNILLSSNGLDISYSAKILKNIRGIPQNSDHAPITVELDI